MQPAMRGIQDGISGQDGTMQALISQFFGMLASGRSIGW
jgi:hypothetical protein